LEEYLNDPDFESNRRQYIEGKERGKTVTATKNTSAAAPAVSKATETIPARPGNLLVVIG
jgi:hypothetical protein